VHGTEASQGGPSFGERRETTSEGYPYSASANFTASARLRELAGRTLQRYMQVSVAMGEKA